MLNSTTLSISMSTMNIKQSPGKITLGMIKGKPITTSVPVIHYHASDDELEELYPSTDEDKDLRPGSERHSPKIPASPSKSIDKKAGESSDSNLEKRSLSTDCNLSEGTPPSDPWKVLSDIKGKITKTFEEKLHEIKSERRKKRRHSKENSSVSDSEDLVDITPTEENISDKQEKDSLLSISHCKDSSTRFSFSQIKTGLKTKNSEEDSVESGIEAAEFAEDVVQDDDNLKSTNNESEIFKNVNIINNNETLHRDTRLSPIQTTIFSNKTKSTTILLYLRQQLFQQIAYQFMPVILIICCSYYFISLPEYFLGFLAGILITVTTFSTITQIKKILVTLPEEETAAKTVVPVLEIPAAEEHAVLERYEGWLNELPYPYDPENYHVARTKSVLFRLEGNILRIMETRMRVPKRAIWDEPKHKLRFTRKRMYNLTGATIDLLPEGLIRRRRWSKKYPICIILEKSGLIENIALKEPGSKGVKSLEEEFDKTIIEEDEGEEEKVEEGEELEKSEIMDQQHEEEEYEEDEEEETDEDFTQAKDLSSVFEDCIDDDDDESDAKYKIYIFARADRQKEDWYRRLVSAANLVKKKNSITLTGDTPISLNSLLTQQGLSDIKNSSVDTGSGNSSGLSYNVYMTKYLDMYTPVTSEVDQSPPTSDIAWFNCLLGRILFDMYNCPDAVNLIQDKIQRKLSNIKLPYFMESLLVSEVVINQGTPLIHQITKPIMDERGLWIDLNMTYKGCITMTVETKLNLMKLTRTGSISSNSSDVQGTEKPKPARSPIFDSDIEDSPETSTEEEDTTAVCSASKDLTPTQSSSRKFLSMVDKIAANKYFQHATELSYVRKAMEGVSNTEIRLMVSVSSIEGCLSINIPPSPTDRLWYGFKPVPKITLTVKPALGERTVNIVYVTKWIETKLVREFEKLVVLPNMDDLIIPLCPNFPYKS